MPNHFLFFLTFSISSKPSVTKWLCAVVAPELFVIPLTHSLFLILTVYVAASCFNRHTHLASICACVVGGFLIAASISNFTGHFLCLVLAYSSLICVNASFR